MSRARPLNIMLLSCEPARLHMAFLTATSAAATGRLVSLFFTSDAVRLLLADAWDSLPGHAGASAQELDARHAASGTADTVMLMDAVAALNVRLLACEASLAANSIQPENLTRWAGTQITTVADFLADGSGGDFLTF